MMRDVFGITSFEISKEDMKKSPDKPILKMFDEDELIGEFDIETGNIIFNNDMGDYDIKFAKEYLLRNKESLLETWQDYVVGWR